MSWYSPITNFIGSAAKDVGKGVGDVESVLGGASNLNSAINQASQLPNTLGPAPISQGAQAAQAATPADVSASGGGTGGGKGGSGSGGGSAAAPTASNGVNAQGGASNFGTTFNNALGQIQNSYNGLFGTQSPTNPTGTPGSYQNAVGSAAANLQGGYQGQFNALNGQFAQAQNQLPWELAGRGANSSSWADNNVNYAQQQQQASTGQLQQAENTALSGLQSQEAQNQGLYSQDITNWNNPQFQAMLPQMSSYEQSEQYSNLQQALANLAGTAGANQPIPAELQSIQNIPVYQQQGGQNIASALQQLAGSPTTSAAQNQIAQGIIGNPTNPQSAGVWQNYYNNLQQNPNTPLPSGA